MISRAGKWGLAGTAVVAALGVGRVLARRRRRHQPDRQDGWYVVHRGITVDRPVDEVIAFLADRERLGAAWHGEITVDGPRRLSWRAADGRPERQGQVELVPAPQDRGTEIRADLRWRSHPGRRVLGRISGTDPDLELRDALRRIKSLIECGQLIDARHDPSGRSPRQEKLPDKVRDRLTTGGRA